MHAHRGPMSHTPHSQPQVPSCLKFKKKYGWILFVQATYSHTVLSPVVVVDRFPPAILYHLHLCYNFQLVSPFVHTFLCNMTVPILC